MSGVEQQDREAANLLVEIVQDAGFGYSINLTRLVDGAAEYTLTYNGDISVHPDTDEAYARLRQLQAEVKTDAALAFIQSIRHEARKAGMEQAARIAEQWIEPVMATPHENATYRSIATAIRSAVGGE